MALHATIENLQPYLAKKIEEIDAYSENYLNYGFICGEIKVTLADLAMKISTIRTMKHAEFDHQ